MGAWDTSALSKMSVRKLTTIHSKMEQLRNEHNILESYCPRARISEKGHIYRCVQCETVNVI